MADTSEKIRVVKGGLDGLHVIAHAVIGLVLLKLFAEHVVTGGRDTSHRACARRSERVEVGVVPESHVRLLWVGHSGSARSHQGIAWRWRAR